MSLRATDKFVGAYVEPLFLLTHGISRALDFYQEDARIQNLFFRGYVFHKDEANEETGSKGGAFFTPDSSYYRNTFLNSFQSSKGGDLLERLIEESTARNVNVYMYLFPAKTPPLTVEGYENVLEKDVEGTPTSMACWRHPDYLNHLLGTAGDLAHNHSLKGFMWGAERCGPLGWMILKRIKPFCFCEHCCRAAMGRNIDVERAKEGWRKLNELFQNVRSNQNPPEGVFVYFVRLLADYPQILAWEKLWWDGKADVKKGIYRIVKNANPLLTVGHHLWHRGSFAIFDRAALDYNDLCEYADFVKPAVFSNPASFRMREQVVALRQSVFGDLEESEIGDAIFRFLRCDREGDYNEMLSRPFGPRYVGREMERAVKMARGRMKVYAGIAATTYSKYPGIHEATTDQVAGDLRASIDAGVDGVILGSVDMVKMAKAIGQALTQERWV